MWRPRLVGIADQGASTLSNLAITVAAARVLDRERFGGFALVFAVYVVAIGIGRALAMEPLLVRGVDRSPAPITATVGSMAALGAVAGVGCVLAGAVTGGVAGPPLIVLGACLPLLFAQDGWRYAAFAVERPERALLVDVVWLGAQVVGTAVVAMVHITDPAAFMAVWAVSGSIGAVAGGVAAAAVPHPAAGVRWAIDNFDFGGPFTMEFLAAGGAGYVALWLLGGITGLPAVGAVRVGQTVLGPVNVLYLGIFVTLVPQGVRRARADPAGVRRIMVGASVALVALSALATTVALVLPGSAGRALFGRSWATARPLLAPLGLGLCGGGVMAGATAGLRSLGRARLSLGVRLATLPATVVLPLLGAAASGVVGFTIGLAVATWIGAAAWWLAFGRALRGLGHDRDLATPVPECPVSPPAG